MSTEEMPHFCSLTRLLSCINSPADLKKLELPQLEDLARELRRKIIKTVAENGGHLAPSLGVVELTIALHYIFNAPQDKIIWDVGHQAYAHKLLTGRFDRFHTLRRYQGLSGFPKRAESPYDALDTGHASTSISAGLGMSVAKELKQDDSKVIVVIGDGSMTGGMAYEALNQAGHLDKNLIVIFNDNEMSIAPNVGALSAFMSRRLTGRTYVNLKDRFQNALKKLPSGQDVIAWAKKGEEAFKSFFTPGMLFEAFKFDYQGPVNGHRLDKLLETFSNLDHLSGPVLIHVQTKKGKGFQLAEENPSYFHGIGSFGVYRDQDEDMLKGVTHPTEEEKTPSYTKVFGRTLCKLAHHNEKLVTITAAMPEGTGLGSFGRAFPDRFFDVAIAEQHAVTFAAGMALEGFVPVVAIYSTFMQRAYDQIIHDVCLQNVHVVLAMDRGGIVGEDGPTHHGLFDLSYLRAVPNLTLMVPRNENILQHMLLTAVEGEGPMALRYPRGQGVGVEMEAKPEPLPLGKGEVLREGDDLLMVGVGPILYQALEVSQELEREGISAAVVDARFVTPLDRELICSWAKHCGRVVTLEENVLAGGFGSAVLECLSEAGLVLPLKRIGVPDKFVEHGSPEILRNLYGLDAAGIHKTVRTWVDTVEPKLKQAKIG